MTKAELSSPKPFRAVAYARMSTDAQNHSIRHQLDGIHAYAAAHGHTIVREFVDEGRSGLSLFNRPALQQLLAAATGAGRDFSVIIVYDVSRWGRFQDADESAFYEYMCRKAGVSIVYCAENFVDDGSPLYAIMKSIKRAMAAEYSRELSAKVFHAQCAFSRLGYKQGGRAGYGLRRIPIGANGDVGATLAPGERKPMLTDRVALVPGDAEELAVIRRVFHLFIEERLNDTEIARLLRAGGGVTHMGVPWSPASVRRILTNERYCGKVLYNKTTRRMHARVTPNPEDLWVRCDRAIVPIVSQEDFEQARQIRHARAMGPSRQDIIDGIRALFDQHGKITIRICKRSSLPGRETMVKLFGGYVQAYAAAGLPPLRSPQGALGLRTTRALVEDLFKEVVRKTAQAGAMASKTRWWNVLRINDSFHLRVSVASCTWTEFGNRWRVQVRKGGGAADFILYALMEETNDCVWHYLLLSTAATPNKSLYLSQRTLARYSECQFATLDDVFGLPARAPSPASDF